MNKLFDSHWERVRFRLSPANLRLGLAVLSLIALVLGGAADVHWV